MNAHDLRILDDPLLEDEVRRLRLLARALRFASTADQLQARQQVEARLAEALEELERREV